METVLDALDERVFSIKAYNTDDVTILKLQSPLAMIKCATHNHN